MRKLKLLVALSSLLTAMVLSPAASRSQGSPDSKLIEAAKKEGEVVWYSSMTLEQGKQVVDRFQKKYPFIKALFSGQAAGLYSIRS